MNAWVDFHLLHLLSGPFRSLEGGQSQCSPLCKITIKITLTGKDYYAAPSRYKVVEIISTQELLRFIWPWVLDLWKKVKALRPSKVFVYCPDGSKLGCLIILSLSLYMYKVECRIHTWIIKRRLLRNRSADLFELNVSTKNTVYCKIACWFRLNLFYFILRKWSTVVPPSSRVP